MQFENLYQSWRAKRISEEEAADLLGINPRTFRRSSRKYEEEGTWSTFRGVKEVIIEKGLFCSFYTDRGSHYWMTPKAGEKVDENKPTQVNRALKYLGIEMIPAYSPEARGRSERTFGTIQGRLPQELRLEQIKNMSEANRLVHFV